MATRKTTAKSKTDTHVEQKTEGVTLEQALTEEGEGRTRETIKNKAKKTGGSTETEQAMQITEKLEAGITLEQALTEEKEGRTREKLDKVPTKMERATKIMEEMWNDIQSG